MKNLKKKIAGLLAAVMTLVSCSLTALAAEGDVVTDYGTVPVDYADKAFAAFSGGEFLGAYEALYEGTSTTSGQLTGAGIIPAVRGYMKSNPMNAKMEHLQMAARTYR